MIKVSILLASIAAICFGVFTQHHTDTSNIVGMLGMLTLVGLLYLQHAANDWTLSQIGLYREGDQIKSQATNRAITYTDVAQIDDFPNPY